MLRIQAHNSPDNEGAQLTFTVNDPDGLYQSFQQLRESQQGGMECRPIP
jgi:hypothetical protein